MTIPAIRAQTPEIAGQCRALSFQSRRATPSLTAHVFFSHTPHPNSRGSAVGANGAPHEGLLPALLLPAPGNIEHLWKGSNPGARDDC
jgi:hypothetical protein